MILVDGSVWIEYFRRGTRLELEEWVEVEAVVTCLPIIQEVLQGFAREAEFRIAREAMHAFAVVESPMSVDIFDAAIDLYRSARRAGRTVRSSVDCLIAACALKHDLEVLHLDRDFASLASISPLRERSIAAR